MKMTDTLATVAIVALSGDEPPKKRLEFVAGLKLFLFVKSISSAGIGPRVAAACPEYEMGDAVYSVPERLVNVADDDVEVILVGRTMDAPVLSLVMRVDESPARVELL